MLLKITRLNGVGERKECVVNTDYIIGITEKRTRVENLFDECGNLVETRELPLVYEIVLKGGTHTIIEKETYDKLIEKLNVETL
jgi:hypothetical protein